MKQITELGRVGNSSYIVIAIKKGSTRNYLLQDFNNVTTPFVICSHLIEDNNKVTWDWGHYYNDLLSAVMDFYKDDLNEKYDFENIFVMLNELDYGINGEKRELTEKEKKMVNNFSDFYNFLENNKEF